MTDESAKVRTLTLDLHLEAGPGQFVMAWLPGLDEKPFSLVSAAPVIVAVARVGPFTEAVHGLAVGDRLWLRGPLGRGFTLPHSRIHNPKSKLLLVAGGYGVAPLFFLASRALSAGWGVSTVIGARTSADVVFSDRFAASGAEVTVTTDDGSLGERGLATGAAARLLDEAAAGGRAATEGCPYEALYACGPEPMLAAAEHLACARHLPAQLSYERYMRCGFGVCGSCAHEGWLVCRDGPVKSVGQPQGAAPT